MKIIFEDESIIVIYKPAGLATQSANISQKDCVSLIKEHIKKNNPSIKGEPYVGIIHRLDQPVAGLLVFAKTRDAAAKLSEEVQKGEACKKYHALVEGEVDMAEETEIVNYMYKDSKNNKAVIVTEADKKGKPYSKDVKKAVLFMKSESYDSKNNTSLVDITLMTGRFHQIRSQLSNMGHPIAGDKKYGSSLDYTTDYKSNEPTPKGAIALKADRLEIIHPKNKKKMIFSDL